MPSQRGVHVAIPTTAVLTVGIPTITILITGTVWHKDTSLWNFVLNSGPFVTARRQLQRVVNLSTSVDKGGLSL